jgi:hypothetical protein
VQALPRQADKAIHADTAARVPGRRVGLLTVNWKPQEEKFGGGESCFGINFREDYPELAKQMSDASGMYQNGTKAKDDKYNYSCKVVNKDQKTYVFITRKPLLPIGAAATPTVIDHRAERDAEIKKMHDESYKLELEKFELAKQQFALDQAFVGVLSDIAHQLQIIAKFSAEGKSFQLASQLSEAKAK